MTRKALVTGITGQDGSYLAELLVRRGYQVWGLIRRTSNDPLIRIPSEIKQKIAFVYGNMRDICTLEKALQEAQPDEVYNLAAQSDVGISFKNPDETKEINYFGVGRLVNAAMETNPRIRIYQASTSEMFGNTPPPQNEISGFVPVSPYGLSKLKAHEDFIVGYREKHGLFSCSGILFNHESPRRGEHFVTRKITLSLAKIKFSLQGYFELGNLDAKRDWGFAGDYVEAMWRMLQQDIPGDFVISSGETHSVREFVEVAASCMDIRLHWEGAGLNEVAKDDSGNVIVKINPKFFRPQEVRYLCGDSSRARFVLGWRPQINFYGLVEMMASHDLDHIRKSVR